ncbi:hypothetical protein D8674_036634 [Pyrus ussuriensis x Pyrus communis]|uniref:RNase H type-1 domain-containing protein n=1 Tax=Pyrus ussuriensis x Pyrus communis TaxID=2448454 RepID=A0A5N5I6D0_9ROSA|nr:hypothetical protein D8674_036634 [Pyrus ussuriensis x Pyrus communis]
MNAWRLYMDIIPSRANLVKRQIISDSSCVLCGCENEIGVHILRDCPCAACVWSFKCNPLNAVVSHTISWWQNFLLVTSYSLPLHDPPPPRLHRGNGTVIRDSARKFVDGLSKSFTHVPSPFFAKAFAIRYGLALASSKGFHNLTIESDSHQIIQALSASSPNLSPFGLIVEDVRKISLGITGVSFTHIKRQAKRGGSLTRSLQSLVLQPCFLVRRASIYYFRCFI